MKFNLFVFGLFTVLLSISCRHKPATQTIKKPSFKRVVGIHYTEVRRTFKSSVIFNQMGLQLHPEWLITFLSDDSCNIYSPEKKRFFHAPVLFDHDSVFNVAWAWFKVGKITKDSLKFQVLFVENKVISHQRSNMFMTLYADDYISKVLHSQASELQKPRKIDSMFIINKAKLAKTKPEEAFASTDPVVVKSNSPLVTVKKEVTKDDPMEDINTTNDYLQPEYTVTIHKAYDDFNYSFTAYVDDQGGLSFRKSQVYLEPGSANGIIRVMKGIISGYLKHYLAVTPGKTLDIPHASIVILNVKGVKD